ncbi:endolytic transglycosylase MltG [Bacteroidetes bacterium endosymbiont of Geopemphigus sp.]|uniref:endolytic transglycosylase MltG n=1 Tax=Bacteroidetes bacterium endosymbiont of Geopemphigus sp. TaxID=2047937 RepID=UPI000CD154C8|nr:endolytic transglycosylase MltG [Bacteroidetes bacterium endosymbiont of Geopemphigus sp.]
MRSTLRWITIFFLGASIFFFYKYYKYFFDQSVLESTEFFIPTGFTYDQVKSSIAPLIKDSEAFDWVARQKSYSGKIKPGKYKLTQGESNWELVNKLRSGQQLLVKLNFAKQETLIELVDQLARFLEPKSEDFMQAILDWHFLHNHQLSKESVRGLFIANTYELYWNTSPKAFLERMLKEYQRFWNEKRREKTYRLGLTPLQVITLASIVQKETSKSDEMPRIAGLYLNRLRDRQKLQADPTVVYAMKSHMVSGVHISRLFYKDLSINSPYNTYMYYGLPPGPICFPQTTAIDAVLQPESHSYYFMVASVDRKGYHEFSTDAFTHEKFRQRYLRFIKQHGLP